MAYTLSVVGFVAWRCLKSRYRGIPEWLQVPPPHMGDVQGAEVV
jgi:hypothetical protein